MMNKLIGYFLFYLFSINISANNIIIGAVQKNKYFSLIGNKSFALVANNASVVNNQNILLFLINNNLTPKKIFTLEHGFNNNYNNNYSVNNKTLQIQNRIIPLISLYNNKKLFPATKDMQDVDVILFDIQDVGVRFYTYLSSLENIMMVAEKNNKQLIVLDRPNPNTNYIDGPILNKRYKSFVGMQSIPIVYGMTIGEYALMLQGEQYKNLHLVVIPLLNYKHSDIMEINFPSPNLPNMQAVQLYPSLALFEGTQVSVGRGTKYPFQVYGYPEYPSNFKFVVNSSDARLIYNKTVCRGVDLRKTKIMQRLNLKYLIDAYKKYPDKNNFFTPFFKYIVGNNILQKQIEKNIDEQSIRLSWEKDKNNFKKIRAKYLLYN